MNNIVEVEVPQVHNKGKKIIYTTEIYLFIFFERKKRKLRLKEEKKFSRVRE